VYGFVGTFVGLGMVICYILMSAAVIRFYWRDHRAEFSSLRHGVFPVAGALLMLLPIYGLVWPVPAYPLNLVPWITIGCLAFGAAYLLVIHRRRRDLQTAMERVFAEPGTTDSASTAGAQAAQEPA
jgi:amino acid transporter